MGGLKKMQENEVLYIHASTIRVRYSETDSMGVVYNSHYLTWFEVARTEICRKFGTTYKEWEQKGYGLPVVEAYCRYKRSAVYDDEVFLFCRTPIETIKPHSVIFEYRAQLEDGALLAEGWTKHAFVSKEGKVIKRDNQFQIWLQEEARKAGH